MIIVIIVIVLCRNEVWSMKMPDSVLAIQSTEDCTVFAALADGFVAVLQVSIILSASILNLLSYVSIECVTRGTRQCTTISSYWLRSSNLSGTRLRAAVMVWLWSSHYHSLLTVSVFIIIIIIIIIIIVNIPCTGHMNQYIALL